MFNLFPLNKGIKLMRQGSFVDAAVYFKSLIKNKIELPQAHFNLARCYLKLKNDTELKANLHKVLDYQYSQELAWGILEMTNWKMLCSNEYFNNSPSFSYDGKKVVFVSVRRDTNGDGKLSASDCGGIYIVDTETGEEQYIVSDEYYNLQPKFSPDGKKLTYLSVRKQLQDKKGIDSGANPALFLLNLETGQETELVSDVSRTKHYSFSRDSKKIIFSCWRPENKNSGIYSLDLETKKMDVLVTDLYENTFPSISEDGKKLIFSSWRWDTNKDGVIDIKDNSSIYIKNLFDGSESMLTDFEYNSTFPSFSPDNSKVLFLSFRHDTNKDGVINSLDNPGIYCYDLQKKKEYCLVNDKSFNKFPSFTPEGNEVVFLSSWRRLKKTTESRDFFENKGIYVLNIPKMKIKRLVSDKYYGCHFPVVSPCGNKVAFVSWRGGTNRGLYLANLNYLPTTKELRGFIDNNL